MIPDTTLPKVPQIKVCTGLLKSNGTGAPTVITLHNTIGQDVSWARESTGLYSATSSGQFTEDKTWLIISPLADPDNTLQIYRQSINTVLVETLESGVNSDDVLEEYTSFEIRIYT